MLVPYFMTRFLPYFMYQARSHRFFSLPALLRLTGLRIFISKDSLFPFVALRRLLQFLLFSCIYLHYLTSYHLHPLLL